MFLHTKHYRCRQTFPLVGSPTSDGDGPLVDHEPGASRSGLTSEYHLVTTGTPVSTVATAKWRNGPQGLRGNDDDDNDDDDDEFKCVLVVVDADRNAGRTRPFFVVMRTSCVI